MSTTSRTACDRPISLHRVLEEWSRWAEGQGDHIDDARLEVLAQKGGMVHALPHEADHLSLCPRCLERWNRLVQRDRASCGAGAGAEGAPVASLDHCALGGEMALDYCMVQAAASSLSAPVEMESASGDFTVSVLPDMEGTGHLVTLQVAPAARERYEGREAVVRDFYGNILFKRAIVAGRAAARVEGVSFARLKLLSIITK